MSDPVLLINSLESVRGSIIGRNLLFKTPYGEKPLVYADYTASGRAVDFIEDHVRDLLNYYANSHTEDDFTGETMTRLLHDSEAIIKKIVRAGDSGKIIFAGSGATGAICTLQKILGVYCPPATRKNILASIDGKQLDSIKPVVFVGPYEHHSNEIMWRQNFCTVVEIPLDKNGEIDLIFLENVVSSEKYKNRKKIGSFSAASNVSGIRTPVYEVAKILHRHDALACFDFAASAPYVEINMNKDDDSYFDAICLSPHKFLGGPGAAGLLIFNERIYQKELPPTIAAGGTVRYVTHTQERFVDDIEEREKPGTPGILQAFRTALAFQLKEKIGIEAIEVIEKYFFKKFIDRFAKNDKFIIYGVTDPEKKINIVSFNIKHGDRFIHPKLFTRLLNDLFGIQTRAGCSCAGPYGHILLSINEERSNRFIDLIDGYQYAGLKPGWVRLNFHYSLSLDEFEYICQALEMLSDCCHKFLDEYVFNFKTGEWRHFSFKSDVSVASVVLNSRLAQKKHGDDFRCYLNSAREIIEKFSDKQESCSSFDREIEDIMFFYVTRYLF